MTKPNPKPRQPATSNILNELINPHTAKQLPASVLPTLRQILYEGLHNIYFFSIVIVALALVANHFEAKKVLAKAATQESDEEAWAMKPVVTLASCLSQNFSNQAVVLFSGRA